ncbi:MAG TPA: methionine--tRNA ligase [Candidatus Paceibacterota bacterium]|nr:methionine--tRNA ligase [Candidatus Paceibacterota bacterium]
MEKILITTPIYYVNDKPHIGHAYTTLAADVLARFFRAQGNDVFFLTGTDEHGIKVAEAAEKLGKKPQQICDENSEIFKKVWTNLGIKYDYFIRTTEKQHEEIVKKFITKLKEKNAVYEKEYTGLYCKGCEKFLTEKDLIDGLCPDHKREPEKISEKNYFFKLTDFLREIEKLVKKGKLKIEPERAKNEVLGLLNQGLEDFSISRQKERLKWGIDLPFDENQVVYVWVDALLNYKTGDGSNRFEDYWKHGKVIHLLAKDILKFHAIYWPAMLLAAGEILPDTEFIHGFFTINGQKMSKTLGNVIDPNNLVERFGTDAARYILLSQFPLTQDGDVKEEKFVEKYNSDLANGIGNLTARILTLSIKNGIKKANADKEIEKTVKTTRKNHEKLMEDFKLYEAIENIWELIGFCDRYIEQNKPWELVKTDKKKLEQVLSSLLYALSEIADLIAPFLPETSGKIKNQLKTGKTEILFPRI